MCLIAWHWQPASPTPLLLLANRDEYYARPSRSLQWWDDADILAGRDLQAGGTWLGISRSGRLAALTNHRDPAVMRPNAPSRGELVSTFLQSDHSARTFLSALADCASRYNPFNLLVFDGASLLGLESRHARIIKLVPGVGAVSNADFQTPWPKLATLKSRLQALVAQGQPSDAELLALLHNRHIAADADLPATGIPMAIERALSAAFITLPEYGTRACSIVRIAANQIEFLEQVFDAGGGTATRQQTHQLQPSVPS
ncbi:MAG: NRDE family protein [Rhodoferax sp.]